MLLFFRPALPEPDCWLERKNDPMMSFAMILFTGAMLFGSVEVGMRSPVAGGAARVLGGSRSFVSCSDCWACWRAEGAEAG
ncbi:hypothetical protein DYH09_16285 [bacterium CPR1]|nr:hypothetical protein [bacterium CPR1]